MVSLPLEVGYGTVKGRILLGVKDSLDDPDLFPDGVPASGTITFTPMVDKLNGTETIIVPKPISVVLDNNGEFIVTLVATDDDDLVPVNWTYKVTFDLVEAIIAPFFIGVPGGGAVTDLTQLMPLEQSSGVIITRGATGPPGPGPTNTQVATAVDEYFVASIDAKVASGVEDYLTAHPPAELTAIPLPAATGTNDTAAIQAILTANPGKRIAGRPGSSYRISAPLTIASGTTLDMTGCTVTLIAGSNCRMIQNAALSGSGARDVDITVRGGYWDRGANGGTTSNDTHSIVLHRADRVAVTDVRFTATGGCKYSVYLCDVTYGRVERCDFISTSDGVHVTGPASQITIRDVSGYTDDDLVSFTGRDYPSYELTAGGGVITDVAVERVTMRGGDGNAVKLLPGAAMTLSAAVVRNVTGSSLVHGVTINEDTAQASTTGGAVRDVLIDGVTFEPGASSSCVDVTCPDVTNLRLRNITQKSTTSPQAVNLVGTALGDIEIDGLTAGTVTSHTKNLVKVAAGCTISRLRVSNVSAVQSGVATILTTSGTISMLQLTGVRQTGGASLVHIAAGASLPIVTINSLHSTADYGVRQLATTAVEIHATNVTAMSGTGLVYLSGAGSSAVLRGAGISAATAYQFARSSTQVITIFSFDIRGDVSIAAPTANAMMYNSNAGRSCGAGPVVANGTIWKHLYTGATYTP